MPKERGPKGLQRSGTIQIVKPDLTKSRYFNSKHTTPNESMDQLNQKNQTQINQTLKQTQNMLTEIREDRSEGPKYQDNIYSNEREIEEVQAI